MMPVLTVGLTLMCGVFAVALFVVGVALDHDRW